MNRQHSVTTVSLLLLLGVTSASQIAVGQGATSNAGSNDAMLLLLEQNRNMQAEIQALRAMVEEQGFQIRRLQRESLDRYTNTDTRLSNLEQALAGGSTGGVVIQPPTPSPGTSFIPTGPQTDNPGSLQSGIPDAVAVPPVDRPGIPESSSSRGLVTDRVPPAEPSGAVSQARDIPATSSPASPPTALARNNDAATRPSLEPAVLSEQQLYQMAYNSAINSQFERAIAEFDQYLSLYPQGRFITNAHYWKGQSYLYLSRYGEAIAEYDIILQQFRNDPKVPDAMYGQAVAFEGMGNRQRATQLLREIIRSYPNTGVANLADTRLRSLN